MEPVQEVEKIQTENGGKKPEFDNTDKTQNGETTVKEEIKSNASELKTTVVDEMNETKETDTKDPEEWIKENILQREKNNIIRSMYLSRLGFKTGATISKEKFEEVDRITKSVIGEEPRMIHDENLKLENSYSAGDYSLNFLIKSDDEVRKNFIDKLFTMKLIKKEPAKKHQSSNSFVRNYLNMILSDYLRLG